MKRLGLIVNPIAGMGGSVGMKGTDGSALQRAKELGALQQANTRTSRALKWISDSATHPEVFCYSGEMGGETAASAGLNVHIIGSPQVPSGRQDTIDATQTLLTEDVDLIIFVGGDGTARDIESVLGMNIPVIGVPAGVKMHSAVFANSPNQAGQLAVKYLKNEVRRCNNLEVMDIDEALYRKGQISASLYGYLQVPYVAELVQGPKTPVKSSDDETAAIAQSIIEHMDTETIYLIGPGTTSKAIMRLLELEYTLIGVDVIRNKKLLALDVNEAKILDLIKACPARIVVSIIGGQGFLFGRGNQQLSSRVLRKVGLGAVTAVAAPEKLMTLSGRPLRVDLNDPELESEFPRHIRVITGYNEETVYPIFTDE